MKPREYCCCAIPLVNFGIYATLTEQFSLGVLVGTLSVATPSIVGAVTPAAGPWILGIVAYIAAGIQVLGFLGVAKEKPITFRRYVTLHIMSTIAGFSVALVWIIMSATGHARAQSRCQTNFFPTTNGSPTSPEGVVLCNIFPWVDVGIMGALWISLAAVQFYFYLVVSSYSSAQQRDHANFDSEYDPTNPLTRDIPMTNKAAWGGRDSPEYAPRGYGHLRQESEGSISSLTNYPYHQRKPSVTKGEHSGYDPAAYPFNRKPTMRGLTIPEHPENAHTQEPNPTPGFSDAYGTGGAGADSVDRPKASQVHPGES